MSGGGDLTQGWDTLFAVHYSDANAAIAAAWKNAGPAADLPLTFSSTVQGALGSCSVNGVWQPWRLEPAGASAVFRCAVLSGTIGGGLGQFSMDGDAVEAQVDLHFVDDTPADSVQPKKLMVLDRPKDNDDPPVVVTYQPSADSPQAKLDAKDLVTACLQQYFNGPEGIAKFRHVFSTVNINLTADQGPLGWIKPTATGYSVAGTDSADTSVLAVLCMTENRPLRQPRRRSSAP